MNPNAYVLKESQVATPDRITRFFWKLIRRFRESAGATLDLGAGTGQLARHGIFRTYLGAEIDQATFKSAHAEAENVQLIRACAFDLKQRGFDTVIGNPPYERHQDIDSQWRDALTKRFKASIGVDISGLANLFTYFIALGIELTREDGLVAMIVPFEWVTRPSAAAIRGLVRQKKWDVHVYRLAFEVFPGVMTTASISLIDKARATGKWNYYDVNERLKVTKLVGPSGAGQNVLPYISRGAIWAMRALSPGGQEVFVLTEEERVRHGLSRWDVVPCVSTLRNVPHSWKDLTAARFERRFVRGGERCWLVRADKYPLSESVRRYLRRIPRDKHDNYTCNTRRPWYRFATPQVPGVLVASGFVSRGPKIMRNSAGVVIVGGVYGVHGKRYLLNNGLVNYLRKIDIEKAVVPHSNALRKIEVRQLNGLLGQFLADHHG
jgi:predicted RNA methylase